MEAQMLLRNSELFPSDSVLRDALGNDAYGTLDSFLEAITGEGYNLVLEWRYYNDGKAWLGKAVYKKKTVFWLSVWKGLFKVSFYFTEKHREAIARLDISENIKERFANSKPTGRLIPMVIEVISSNQLYELLTLVGFKKNLK